MSNERNGKRSKVAQLIEEYDLSEIGEELEHRWTRTEDRSSLRDLADYFNRQLLRAVLDSVETEPLDGGIDNVYRHLRDDEVTSGVRQETRARLKQRGVDVDTLENSFVSYQAIRTYLREYRNATPPDNSTTPKSHRERKRTTIQQLVSRLVTVTEGSLTELKNAGHLTIGDFDVLVTVRVHCASCDTRVPVSELLRQGSCQCPAEPPSQP